MVLSGGSGVSLGPRDRRAQRPATRAGLPREGAPGPRARTLRCWRPEPRAAGAPSFQVTGASDPRLEELPAWPQESAASGSAARLRVHHAGRLGEARSGAFVCNSEQQPTHPHALCLLTGRSPES